MDALVGLSAACTACWVDNMACDAATCKEKCLLAKLTRAPPVDKHGNLNALAPRLCSFCCSDHDCYTHVTQLFLQLPRVRRGLLRRPVHPLRGREPSAQRHTQVALQRQRGTWCSSLTFLIQRHRAAARAGVEPHSLLSRRRCVGEGHRSWDPCKCFVPRGCVQECDRPWQARGRELHCEQQSAGAVKCIQQHLS